MKKLIKLIGYVFLAIIFLIQILNIVGGGSVLVSAVVMTAIGFFFAVKLQRRLKKIDDIDFEENKK